MNKSYYPAASGIGVGLLIAGLWLFEPQTAKAIRNMTDTEWIGFCLLGIGAFLCGLVIGNVIGDQITGDR